MNTEHVTLTTGAKVRIWGGWYQHTKVLINGVELEGLIQTKREHKRTSTITVFRGACVLGYDVQWLIRQNANPNPQF